MLLQSENILITGVSSGLGKFLYENVPGALGLTRENKKQTLRTLEGKEDLVIVHCAFNAARDPSRAYESLNDNIFLTRDLVRLPHKKFVYISSVGVYETVPTDYGLTKRHAESIVQAESTNYLILRCSALLGPTIRQNSFLKIMEQDNCTLSLSGQSVFNYILQNDILEVLEDEESVNLSGTYDFVSAQSTTLQEVADKYKKDPIFGEFVYYTRFGEDRTIKNLHPHKNRTSLETIEFFLKEHNE
jgi:nucleoside-diphosphate-sugar epimerase|tara:strand:- start:3806 stop:4540 length:735 start_codon:yes stop_codon:yes gene_type:complete